MCPAADSEDDAEGEFDEDEDELDPKGDAKHFVFAMFDSETLVLPADKDGRQHVACNEEKQEYVVQALMLASLKDGQANQANGANEGKRNSQPGEDLFAYGGVGNEAAAVSQPTLGDKRQVEEDGGEDAAGDEERAQAVGTDVADVGDVGSLGHGGVAAAVLVDDPREEHTEEHAQPDEAGDYGEDPV